MEKRPIANASALEPSFVDAPAPAAPDPAASGPSVGPVTDPASEPQRHRVHHSYIWLGSLRTAGVIAAALIVSVLSSMLEDLFGDGERPGLFLVGIIIVAIVVIVSGALAFLYQWWSYRHLWYEISDEEFSLYSGIFNKKRVHVPYQRVQSVDQHASLLQRVFGVCTMSIDTAGGASHTAVQVPYMRKDQAERLRMELYLRRRRVLGMDVPQAATATAKSQPPAPIGTPIRGIPAPAAAVAFAGVSAAPAAGTPAGTSAAAASAGASVATVPASATVGAAGTAAEGLGGNVLDMGAGLWDDVRGVFAGDAVDMGRSSFECRLSNKELVFTGLSNNTGFIIAMLGILATVFQIAGGLGSAMDAAAGAGAAVLDAGGRIFGGSIIVFAIVVMLLAVIALWALSVVGSCIQYGGFVARRRGSRIEVEHGLLQHRIQGVDVDRVQSVIIKQSVIRRLLGYCELSLGKIDAVDSSQSDQGVAVQQGLTIHPFVKLDRVPAILSGLIPEFDGAPTQRVHLPRVAIRRAIIRRGLIQGVGFWFAVIVACAQIAANLALGAADSAGEVVLSYVNTAACAAYVVCAIAFVLEIAAGVLWARGSFFGCNRRFMMVCNGGMAREAVIFPRRKIQFGYIKTNPFQRKARTATIAVRTAAGTGGTTVRLIDVCEDDARTWLEWAIPRVNAV